MEAVCAEGSVSGGLPRSGNGSPPVGVLAEHGIADRGFLDKKGKRGPGATSMQLGNWVRTPENLRESVRSLLTQRPSISSLRDAYDIRDCAESFRIGNDAI